MKKAVLSFSALVGLALAAQASNVIATNFVQGPTNTGLSHPLISAVSSTLLPNGSGTLAVGFFNVPDGVLDAIDSIPAGPGRRAAWQSAITQFVQFGTSATVGGAAAGNTPGLYKFTVGTAVVPGSTFESKNIYTVVGTGNTLAGSDEGLIFKADTPFATDPTPSANADFVGTPPAGTLLVGALEGGTQAFYATGPLGGQQLTAARLAAIPEPTALCISMLGFAGLVFRRRR
ncbi:MAG: PEP-CTERM sorting domain-containing protein [Verrucomicrobiales bacterium]